MQRIRVWPAAAIAGVAYLIVATFAVFGVMTGTSDTISSGADRAAQAFVVINDLATLVAVYGLWQLVRGAGRDGRGARVFLSLLAIGDVAALLANVATLVTGKDPLLALHPIAFVLWLPGMVGFAVVAARGGLFSRWLAAWFAATPVLLFAQVPGLYADALLWIVVAGVLARRLGVAKAPRVPTASAYARG